MRRRGAAPAGPPPPHLPLLLRTLPGRRPRRVGIGRVRGDGPAGRQRRSRRRDRPMIGLRLLHVLAGCDHSLAATGALPLMHWLRGAGHEVGVLCHGGARATELAGEGMAVFHANRGRFPWWFGRRRDLLARLARW